MLDDTIFAVASPPGAAARGIVRLSGPDAIALAGGLLAPGVSLPRRRVAVEAAVALADLAHEAASHSPCADALVLVMPGPASYTGEDVVELHLPGSPLLLAHVCARLRASADARDALPGEFTRRAFGSGRIDLSAAEAVVDLIEAGSRDALRRAAHAVQGGVAGAVDAVRGELLDALALLESGLDFEPDETGGVAAAEWLPLLEAARDRLDELRAAIPVGAGGSGDWLLLGAVNAGKSSLCNALAGTDAALVSGVAGTTRDVLAFEVGSGLRLLDAPGDLAGGGGGQLEADALAARDRLALGCAGVVLVVDGTAPRAPHTELPVLAVVVTKADLAARAELPELPPAARDAPRFVVSARSGAGLDELRAFLAGRSGGPATGGSRIADLLAAALTHVAAAIAAGVGGSAEELVAVELREALERLDAVHGRHSPEDVLDRVFGRFCLGK